MKHQKKIGFLTTSALTVGLTLIRLLLIENENIRKTSEEERAILDNIPTNVPDLIKSFGYPVEEHKVETEDGYILTLHRVPHGRHNQYDNIQRPVVLMAHCLMASSAVYSYGPANSSLAYLLAEEGYDVWLMNVRGNKYSQEHVSLDVNSKQFWNFGIDEPGRYDYPAAIDYILNSTSQEELFYIGYSMGSTHYFIMLSERPEYNDKIKAGFVMGPAVFLGNSSLPLRMAQPLLTYFVGMLDYFGVKELAGSLLGDLSHKACTKDKTSASFCRFFWNLVANSDDESLDLKESLIELVNTPAGSSLKTYKHYLQLLDGTFTKYSYDKASNDVLYGSSTAPEYNLKNVVVPTKMFVGANDALSTVPDIQKLSETLPNSLGYHVVGRDVWNHMDFAYSQNRKELVFDFIIEDMNKFKAGSRGTQVYHEPIMPVNCSTVMLNIH